MIGPPVAPTTPAGNPRSAKTRRAFDCGGPALPFGLALAALILGRLGKWLWDRVNHTVEIARKAAKAARYFPACDFRATHVDGGRKASFHEWRCGPGDELDQIDLPPRAGLVEQVLEVSLDGGLGNAERLGDLPHPADIHHGLQHLKLARRELIELYRGL